MAFTHPSGDDDSLMAEINMTPFVDVMLVLLIVFIVTLPVIQHSVKVQLPKAQSQANKAQTEAIQLTIDAKGSIYWNKTMVSVEQFEQNAKNAAEQSPQPEINLRADKSVVYEKVAQVLAGCKRAGLTKVGFVTEPK